MARPLYIKAETERETVRDRQRQKQAGRER